MAKMLLRRRRYFVRSGFQLKYVGLILAVMFLGTLITGYTIYANSWLLLGDKLANVYPQGRLIAIFNAVNTRLAINMIFALAISFGIGVIASHKIAGPIYRMIAFLHSVTANDDYSKRLVLRKGDELMDLAEAINRLIVKLDSEKKT
ncbi:MAG: hypothetical protein ABID09_06890 [Candidatus Omnitrophota bacterium]